jgi:hypothetical protein
MVIASADVERLQAALVLARDAGLPASGLEAALAAATALREATVAATTQNDATTITNLREAIAAFEAMAKAHCAGRPASGRDLVAARRAFAAATRRQQQAAATAAPSSPTLRPRPQTAGAVGDRQQQQQQQQQQRPGQLAFERWLAVKRAAEADAARRALEAQRLRVSARQQLTERRAVAAVWRYARERGWPSSLVVETVPLPRCSAPLAASIFGPQQPQGQQQAQQQQQRRPKTAPA